MLYRLCSVAQFDIFQKKAGFIGVWGEWWYTDNFGNAGTWSSQNTADRRAVVDAILNVSAALTVQVAWREVLSLTCMVSCR